MDAPIHRREGHSVYAPPALNTAGIVYSAFVVIYTGLLLFGLFILWMQRRKTAVRIRGFWIIAAAVISIHAYVAALFIVYPLNGDFKCGTEFWYMNTVFPLGIATFQASNVRLWAYANAQQSFPQLKCLTKNPRPFKFTEQGLRKWYRQLDQVTKTYYSIVLGLVVQMTVAFVLFFGSRRFSPKTGFFGEHTNPLLCRRGYEWIPSVVWQFFWTWFCGPWVLYKTRHIRDTHFWALQTRLAILAGLPGTPLWLAFLYNSNPILTSIDAWFPPAMWFLPGLMTMQITSMVFPLYDIFRHRKIKRPSSPVSSINSGSTSNTASSSRKSKELAISLPAFEHQLKYNLPPLLAFSTERDFTSENIIFLRDVRNFKLKWRRHIASAPSLTSCLSSMDMRTMYEDAARIYFELVCPATAKFAINLDYTMYNKLENVFRSLEYEPPFYSSEKNSGRGRKRSLSTSSKRAKEDLRKVVAPWDSPPPTVGGPLYRPASNTSSSSETALIDIVLDDSIEMVRLPPPTVPMPNSETTTQAIQRITFEGVINATSDTTGLANPTSTNSFSDDVAASFKGKIVNRHTGLGTLSEAYYVPNEFGMNVFDSAYESIKYLVYTNTWKSYVQGLDEVGIDRLSSLWAFESGLVPRRVQKDRFSHKLSHITDAEKYDFDLELQAECEESSDQALHCGVLDSRAGPVLMEDVDARCSGCRSKREKKVEQIVRSAGFDTDDHA